VERHVAWNVAHGLPWAAARTPDKTAVRDGAREFTYREVNARVNRLAHAFRGLGLEPGDRLLMLLGDRLEHLEVLFACAKVGIEAAPVDPRWRPEEVLQAVDLYQPRAVLFEEATRALAPQGLCGPQICLEADYEGLVAKGAPSEALQPLASDAAFCIASTSGTSGLPKGIRLSHRSMRWRMPIYAFDLGLGPGDVWLSNTPMAQGGGRAFAMAMWIRGGTVLIKREFDAERMLAVVARERVTACMTVPTILTRLLAVPGLARYDLSSLRCVISTGAPLPAPVRVEVLDRLTPSLYQFYSSTESGGITALPPWRQRDRGDSVGTGVFGKELRVDEDGEVLTRGPALMTEYVGPPEVTAAAFVAGWFRTGDVGRLDDESLLYIVGRKKDMIISGGLNIYPAEVERVLHAHPAVQEAAVVGQPDAEWGEIVAAFVQLRPGHRATAADIVEHCRAHMASYKKPQVVEFVRELPRTTSGKIARRELRSGVR
jgi:acyl-CoA synthetase (AMP-forming)/AMP-acid ligase II